MKLSQLVHVGLAVLLAISSAAFAEEAKIDCHKAPPVFGHSSISANAERYGCLLVQRNNSFDTLQRRLCGYESDPVAFFTYGKCENESAEDFRSFQTVPPFFLGLQDPPGRMGILMDFLEYLDNQPDRRELSQRVLNARDGAGRTTLDYLEQLRVTRFRYDGASLNMLNTLRSGMCGRGALHNTPQADCVAHGEYRSP